MLDVLVKKEISVRRRCRRHEQLEVLNCRYELSEDDARELTKSRRGFIGELLFDDYIATNFPDVYHIKDFRFSVDGNECQIDSLIIANNMLFTFDVKNFNFDLIYKLGPWHYTNQRAWGDPMAQVIRSNNLLNQLLSRLNYNLDLESYLVFINKSQTIYNLPQNSKIIVSSNLDQVMKNLLYPNTYDPSQMIEKLLKCRVDHSVYDKQIPLELDRLVGGIFCEKCFSRMEKVKLGVYQCSNVNCKECKTTEKVILRMMEEIKILSPDNQVNSKILEEYSGRLLSSSTIRKSLSRLRKKLETHGK